jgi:hypothetical protein
MKKPGFFIVGAAKAGTTSLYEYLRQHPEIYFSPVKEPNYFSSDIDVRNFSVTYKRNTFLDVDRYFAKEPLEPLQQTYVRKEEHYRKLFEPVTREKIAGEASTSYLVSAVAATNIYRYNPEAKIIVVLRNPADRAFSHYLMALRYGHTTLPFHEAVEKDMSRKHKGIGISEMFIESGMYGRQLERYFRVFPEKQIKILFFDDLVNNTAEVLTSLQHFLGVTPQSIDYDEIHNTGKVPRFPTLNKFFTDSGIKGVIKKVIRGKVFEFLKAKMMASGRNEQLSAADRDFLKEIYREDIRHLSRIINRDLTHWL